MCAVRTVRIFVRLDESTSALEQRSCPASLLLKGMGFDGEQYRPFFKRAENLAQLVPTP